MYIYTYFCGLPFFSEEKIPDLDIHNWIKGHHIQWACCGNPSIVKHTPWRPSNHYSDTMSPRAWAIMDKQACQGQAFIIIHVNRSEVLQKIQDKKWPWSRLVLSITRRLRVSSVSARLLNKHKHNSEQNNMGWDPTQSLKKLKVIMINDHAIQRFQEVSKTSI